MTSGIISVKSTLDKVTCQNWYNTVLLRKGIKITHLRLLAALAETSQLSAAAATLGITQPAASRLLAEMERIGDTLLHQRTGRGLALTPGGKALARRAARVLLEIEDAGRELHEIAEGAGGQVRLGSVTGPAMDLVLPGLTRAADVAPGVSVEVVVATSDVLCEHLMAGRLDFALARLPPEPGATRLRFQHLGAEPVSLVVRRGHPLASGEQARPEALMRYDWVMPGPESVLRRAVLARLRAVGLPDPPGRTATSSFLLTLAILQASDAIAPLATAVARRFATGEGAGFAVVEAGLGIEVEPYGLVTRSESGLTPAARRICGLILPMNPAP